MSNMLKLSGRFEGTDRRLRLNVLLDTDRPGQGYPVYLHETVGQDSLPSHRGNLFINQNEAGDRKWLSVSAPLRTMSDDNQFNLIPRQNAEGQYLDGKGNVVDSAEKAASQFEYIKMDQDGEERLVFGTLATINVQNTKSDGTPNKFTTLNTKFYDEPDALEIARLRFELAQLEKGTPEYEETRADLDAQTRERGTWMTFFIDEGHQFLRDQGFEVRERQASKDNDGPSPN